MRAGRAEGDGEIDLPGWLIDHPLAWALIPLLGAMLAAAMLAAIVYGLTSDEKWDARHNPGGAVHPTRNKSRC